MDFGLLSLPGRLFIGSVLNFWCDPRTLFSVVVSSYGVCSRNRIETFYYFLTVRNLISITVHLAPFVIVMTIAILFSLSKASFTFFGLTHFRGTFFY